MPSSQASTSGISPSSSGRIIPTHLASVVRRWNSSLIAFSNWLMSKLLLYPISSIIWPCVLVLILAYPTIYNSYLLPYNLVSSVFPSPSKRIKFVEFSSDLSDSHADITLKIFSIDNNSNNLLTKEFLLQLYDIQSLLFDSLDVTTDGTELYSNDHSIMIYSPLDYWDNDRSKLLQSDSIVKTIQLSGWHSKSTLNQPLKNVQLFSGISKSDGLVRSADRLKLVCYYRKSEVINGILYRNLRSVKSEYPHLAIFDELVDCNQSNTDSSRRLKLNVSAKYCNFIDMFYMYLVLPILIVQCIMRIRRNKFIRSKIGFIVAFFVQHALTSLASITVVSTFDKHSELFELPCALLILIPFSVNIINISHLILSLSNYTSGISFISRVQKAVNGSFSISTNFNLLVLFILNVCCLFANSKCSLLYCCFTSLCILLNFFLTYTYSLTILIVDFNNVELQDLIQSEKLIGNINEVDYKLPEKITIDDSHSSRFEIEKIFSRFNHSYLTTKFVVFNACSLLVIIPIIFQWTEGVSSYSSKNNNHLLDVFTNKRGFVYELLTLNKGIEKISLEISNPVLLSNNTELAFAQYYHPTTISSTFDVYYFLEFISFLIFAVSTLSLMLRLLIDSEQNYEYSKSFTASESNNSPHKYRDSFSSSLQCFQSKDLIQGHVLDIVKLCTSSCPFIVSVGIDHKVLVWSPLNHPIPIPTQLPISAKFLPITHVEMSDSGSAITVFSRSGEVKCWSRSSMSWVWTILFEELANDTPLVSFFRKRTQISNGRRKLVSRVSRQTKEHTPTHSTLNSRHPPPPSSAATNTDLSSGRRLSLDSNFDQNITTKDASNMEFIIVLKNGAIISIECSTGKYDRAVLSDSPLLCAKKLISPRVNDRIVGVKENGELVVSTVINNKWRSRPVKIDTSNYNKGISLITPAVLLKYPEFNYSTSPSVLPAAKSFAATSNTDKRVGFVDESLNDLQGIVMETVPFVGMIVRAFGSKCQLIDVQSGTVLKEWQIFQFKASTFRVFHPEPSHCRFCGCASVASFSVAYTGLEGSSLIMHTFSIDNRAKNNICLRVERDSRETRCLGFASVTEHQHVLGNVEGWCPTDMNILMGVRRKENSEVIATSSVSVTGSGKPDGKTKSGILNSLFESGIGLRQRKTANNTSEPQKIDETEGDNTETEKKVSPIIENSSIFNRVTNTAQTIHTHRLSDKWEGWTMSADGQVRFYEIPDGSDSGLLIKKLGPVSKFGHKSLVVSFGNIMKVLYLGNDSLVEEDSPGDEDLSSARYQSSSSLGFINRRRRMRMKKYDLTHSTCFEESSTASTEPIAEPVSSANGS